MTDELALALALALLEGHAERQGSSPARSALWQSDATLNEQAIAELEDAWNERADA